MVTVIAGAGGKGTSREALLLGHEEVPWKYKRQRRCAGRLDATSPGDGHRGVASLPGGIPGDQGFRGGRIGA